MSSDLLDISLQPSSGTGRVTDKSRSESLEGLFVRTLPSVAVTLPGPTNEEADSGFVADDMLSTTSSSAFSSDHIVYEILETCMYPTLPCIVESLILLPQLVRWLMERGSVGG